MAAESPQSPELKLSETKEFEVEESSLDATDSFLRSEQEYVEKGLRRGFDIFVDRLEIHVKQHDVILKMDEINDIFSTYKVIYNANSDLLESLMKVRMDRKTELRDNLGDIMAKWLPYLKLYIDYIVKSKEIQIKLNKLRKSNKKFSKFLVINEACARRKIKSFLDEPVTRLPQYLQHMAHIYLSWNKEDAENASAAISKKKLFDAIASVRTVTKEIAEKVKNKKARRLLGILQKKLFNNKIALIASHRLVVHYGALHILNNNDLELCHFILCNDIFVIAKSKAKANANALYHVLPLIGLKIDRDPDVPKNFKNKDNWRCFGIKGIIASAVKKLIVFAEVDEDRYDWINIIEDTVDEEEHSLHPCNPVDLEKRLRKEKCSPAGTAQTMKVTDPAVLKKIQEWKDGGKKKKNQKNGSRTRTATNLSSEPKKKAPPPKGGGRSLNAPPSGDGKKNKPPPRGARGPPPGNKPPPSGAKGPPPPRKKGAAPPGRGGGKPPPGRPGAAGAPTAAAPAKKLSGRAGMLAGIASFNKGAGLKKNRC